MTTGATTFNLTAWAGSSTSASFAAAQQLHASGFDTPGFVVREQRQ